jgi:phosphoadenosine phosphosulfate reductase
MRQLEFTPMCEDFQSARVKESIALIQKFSVIDPEGVYVAFSGGKDSIVALDLVRRSGVRYDAHYNLTSVDPPELVHFIRDKYPEVIGHIPEKSMYQLIAEHRMPPTRRVRYCCEFLKERGGEGRLVVTGLRASESNRRAKSWKVFNECDPRLKATGKRILNPIFSWTEDDVWRYIRANKLGYPALYDEGFKRVGCVMCPMAGFKRMRADALRWPRIAAAYKRAMQRCLDRRLRDGLKTTWTTGDEMFNWWIGMDKVR